MPDNPYFAYLGLADRFVVTADSASLVADACTMEKPVADLRLAGARGARERGVKGLLRRWGEARDRQRPARRSAERGRRGCTTTWCTSA